MLLRCRVNYLRVVVLWGIMIYYILGVSFKIHVPLTWPVSLPGSRFSKQLLVWSEGHTTLLSFFFVFCNRESLAEKKKNTPSWTRFQGYHTVKITLSAQHSTEYLSLYRSRGKIQRLGSFAACPGHLAARRLGFYNGKRSFYWQRYYQMALS